MKMRIKEKTRVYLENASGIERDVFNVLNSGFWDHYWHGYNNLFDDILIDYNNEYTIEQLRGAMLKLRNNGIVEILSTYDEDTGKINGSGWFITRGL